MGRAELESTNVEARMLEVEKAAIDSQGAERLNEIRQSLALEKGGSEAVGGGEGSGEGAAVPAERSPDEG
jgi:hypothetical protein